MKKYRIIPDFYPKEYTVAKLAAESVNFTEEGENILFIVSNLSPVNEENIQNYTIEIYDKLVVYNTHKTEN